jgi:hypothetical protein
MALDYDCEAADLVAAVFPPGIQINQGEYCMRNATAAILFLVSLVFSQTVNITGTVSSGGQPVQGAVVKLFAQALACTSRADGSYSLGGSVATVGTDSHPQTPQGISYKDKSFIFNVPSSVPASVKLYDLSGRMVATVFSGILRRGITSVFFPLNRLGHALWIVRVTMGAENATYTMASAKNFFLSAPSLINGKLSKALAITDWLQGSKAGYASSIQQISSYTGVINITLGALTAPNFGANVKIFDPTMAMSTIQSTMSGFSTGEFSTNRVAWFFKPGNYNLTITTNYYIQAYGLALNPDSVRVTGAVQNLDGTLTAFWRGVEGFSVNPTGGPTPGTSIWGVSQADPFRRMHVKGNLTLSYNGGASGGFMADCKIDGAISPGSQQQFYFRNNTLNGWNGGNWNMLFQGCDNPPAENWPSGAVTVSPKTPLIREKPYLIFDAAGNYSVFVPALRTNSQGTTWYNATPAGELLPIDQFYIAQSATDNATTINAALAQGKNLLLTPGIYSVTAPIVVQRPGTVVLGLGMATIKPQNGVIGLQTTDVGGLSIANILFDAGTTESPVLLQLGDSGSVADNRTNPPIVFDIFARVGGGGAAKATVAVKLNSNDAILDHCWLWRADHGQGAGWTSNPAKTGLIVNGKRAITYGQQVEHYQQHNTIWNGDSGQTYFYQNELPYDVPNQASFMDGTKQGYSAYYVTSGVTNFTGWCIGVYSYFNQAPVIEANGMEVPKVPGVKMHHLLTFSLDNDQGQITHVVNDTGATAKFGANHEIKFGDYVGH